MFQLPTAPLNLTNPCPTALFPLSLSLRTARMPIMAVAAHVAYPCLNSAAAAELRVRRCKGVAVHVSVPSSRAYSLELKLFSLPLNFRSSNSRLSNFQNGDGETIDAASSSDTADVQDMIAGQNSINPENRNTGRGFSFLAKLAIALGIAATITLISVAFKQPLYGSLADGSSASLLGAPCAGFTFKVFGKTVVLPQYPPGWIYFWLLMAAGCGLCVSEEALNIWVGISLARLLSLDGTWSSFIESFSRNAPYIISTVLWVYWGVCISDMVPFYLGKLFRQSGASDDVYSRLGVGKEKARNITQVVQKYGNLIGFVERFSLGVRNPTSFLAGALDISPEYFFAGVCCGGLFTLPLQLGIGFLLRERPVFAVATVASVVGIWTLLPYVIAASTALFLYLRSRISS